MYEILKILFPVSMHIQKTQNQILGGVVRGIFEIQECFVPQKSIFGEKSPARMVTVNENYKTYR